MKNIINELIKSAMQKHPNDANILKYAEMVKNCLDMDIQPYLALRKCISFINNQDFNISGYFLWNIVDNTENGIDNYPKSWLFAFMKDCTKEHDSGFFQIEVTCNKEFIVDTWPDSKPLVEAIQRL